MTPLRISRRPRTVPGLLPLSFGGCEELGAHPFAAGLSGSLGCVVDQREFVVGEAEGYGVAAGVVAGWSSELGHVLRIASTESLANAELRVYDKVMMKTGPAVRTWDGTDINRLAIHELIDGHALCSVTLQAMFDDTHQDVTCKRCLARRARGATT